MELHQSISGADKEEALSLIGIAGIISEWTPNGIQSASRKGQETCPPLCLLYHPKNVRTTKRNYVRLGHPTDVENSGGGVKEKGEGTAKQDASTRNTKSGRASIEVSQTDHPSIYASVILSLARSFVREMISHFSGPTKIRKRVMTGATARGGYEEGEERALV